MGKRGFIQAVRFCGEIKQDLTFAGQLYNIWQLLTDHTLSYIKLELHKTFHERWITLCCLYVLPVPVTSTELVTPPIPYTKARVER